VVELAAQLAAQVQIAIDHVADDAQHHVGRAARHAPCSGRTRVCCIQALGAGQQAAGIGFAHRAVSRVHAQEHTVKHGKADRAGVDAVQHGWSGAFAGLQVQAVARRDLGAVGPLGQPAEHHQVVVRAEVKARWQLGVEQVRDMQIDQGLTGEIFQCVLDRPQFGPEGLAGTGDPEVTLIGQLFRQGLGGLNVCAREAENPHGVAQAWRIRRAASRAK
jgi:hypothetical protein